MMSALHTPNSEDATPSLHVRSLGVCDYETVWRAMQRYTDSRNEETRDELWLVEHPPVFTLGQAGRREHILAPGDIPVLQVDRGGQVTYHGPGQLVAYPLLDLRRMGIGARELVCRIERSVVALLAGFDVQATLQAGAPGVYVQGAKIAALGLRVRRGCSFHGLSINIRMDLEPFQRINPCGYSGLEVTQLSDWTDRALKPVPGLLTECLAAELGHRLVPASNALPSVALAGARHAR